MVYLCGICNKTFSTVAYLKSHLKNTIPCDYVCRNCGIKKKSYDAYIKHIKKIVCVPKAYTEEDIVKMSPQ